ncbi:hypothetical protein M378DRAFT_161739 [Amanita muscaria Koide BX008]|uniref:Uncharacterized protein n=1 Tax=Amanita muscaria (strain Koide BX008) TaxID=946122 RepID=A0A0C2TFV3_AMAMK|nr:hypothetical protein M378DRAFT_161739 [Amanita muscaria Koide BX008]
MPAKYSHIKKRSASGLLKKNGSSNNNANSNNHGTHAHNANNANVPMIHGPFHTLAEAQEYNKAHPHFDRGLTQAMTAVSQLERAIARIFLLRYENDIARLFSTRLYTVSLVHLPTLVMRCATLGGPGWLAFNYDSEEIKDFLRAAVSMDLRQAGERVATKSVLWSYTALRHFALSNNVSICPKKGLHSLRLLPHFQALKAHMDTLEAAGPPTFAKPPHLGSLKDGQDALQDACELKFGKLDKSSSSGSGSASSVTSSAGGDDTIVSYLGPEWDDKDSWRPRIQYGYDKLCQTLWRVAREFDVRGYGNVLRDKLTTKWCDCGCSTDHLGEVCERSVREEEIESGIRPGKQREWDGRGSGVFGWETGEEEDVWETDLDFAGADKDKETDSDLDRSELTIAEMLEYRFIRAEREKEEGNAAFRQGNYSKAVMHYEMAFHIDQEVPHYQLNLAAAHLKLNNWIEAEKACTKALGQHKNIKAYYRRARARRMLKKTEEAIKDLRAALKLQPDNMDAIRELAAMAPKTRESEDGKSSTILSPPFNPSSSSYFSSSSGSGSSSSSKPNPTTLNPDYIAEILERFNIAEPKQPKPPPFSRTKADDRKLKINVYTLSASDYEECLKGEKCRKKDKDGKCTAGHKSKTKATVREVERSSGGSDVVIYPGWDKYVVKKVE